MRSVYARASRSVAFGHLVVVRKAERGESAREWHAPTSTRAGGVVWPGSPPVGSAVTTETTSSSTTRTTARRVAFNALLALTMAASTFAFTTFSVLSQSLLDTFSLSRWQLGALVTATATVGAVTSPALGKVSDRIGGRCSLQITLGLSAFVLAGIAVSPVYLLLVVAALAAGLAQATANPSTNKLIADHVATGGRGTVTGIKQAGVQAGVFLGGSLLPLGALHLGWRPTLLIAAIVPLLGLAVSQVAIPADPDTSDGDTSSRGHASAARSPFLIRLAIYGFLIGAGWSALFTYLPDYAQNALGWRAATAGFVVSVAGVCGMVGRIAWSRLAERRLGAPSTLMILAAIALAAVLIVVLAERMPALLWIGAAALGASSGSWNSVGMFAIIDRMPSRSSGAASGVVMFGFLIGLAGGAPPFGWAVDLTSSYVPGLLAVLVVNVAALGVASTLRTAPLTADGAAP